MTCYYRVEEHRWYDRAGNLTAKRIRWWTSATVMSDEEIIQYNIESLPEAKP